LRKEPTSTPSAGTWRSRSRLTSAGEPQFKATRPEDVVRLKALEKENARLKRLLAEKELDNDMLREVARGNF
jgi:hypothetical protein